MTGKGSIFNRCLTAYDAIEHNNSLTGANCITAGSCLDKDAKSLLNKQRQAELAGLTGIAKVNRQVDFDLQDMGRDGPNNSTLRLNIGQRQKKTITTRRTWQRHRKQKQTPPGKLKKADRDAASQAQRYASKIEDLTIATEVQKVRASEGEKAADFTPPRTRAALNGQPNKLRKFVSRPQSWPAGLHGLMITLKNSVIRRKH
jgi:hypothetical protein